ncbi:hypothetical protein [Martelella sp. HB161492]|uniref:carph-isopro domain-containing protein n=1 Tax=Martelella sp. HB161492 TaxID=2720726 RepID=UPI001591E3E2|nr:hypothetical protein [Martelella sp. HB161492]
MNTAEKIIARFGGLTATARALSDPKKEFPVSTVQGWKIRGRIPERYWRQLVSASEQFAAPLGLEDFLPAESDTVRVPFHG